MENLVLGKSELVEILATKLQVPRDKSRLFLEAFTETVAENLEKNHEIKIMGFGSFKRTYRSEHKGINPKTHEEMMIPASYSVLFKVGSTLKERINKSAQDLKE